MKKINKFHKIFKLIIKKNKNSLENSKIKSLKKIKIKKMKSITQLQYTKHLKYCYLKLIILFKNKIKLRHNKLK